MGFEMARLQRVCPRRRDARQVCLWSRRADLSGSARSRFSTTSPKRRCWAARPMSRRNVVALGGKAILAGAIGDDAEGDLIAGPLVDRDGIVGCLIRVPAIRRRPRSATFRAAIRSCGSTSSGGSISDRTRSTRSAAGSTDAADDISAIVLSDYAKGVLIPVLVRRVIDIARSRGIPVVVDTKTRDVDPFRGRNRYHARTLRRPPRSPGVECVDDHHAEIAAEALARACEDRRGRAHARRAGDDHLPPE